MRFFHLSDLHLGKTLHGYDLLEDQAYILDRVVAKVAELAPEALLIAGDVYDRAVPPVDAIELFDAFLRKAQEAAPGLQIVVVPGNHDSAGRLSFGASLLAGAGLRIAARAGSGPVFVAGEGARKVAVWALPFLTQASAAWDELAAVGAAETEGAGQGAVAALDVAGGAAGGAARSQQALMRLAIGAMRPTMRSAMADGAANVLVAHCFASGGLAGDSELAFVGAAEQVDTTLFEGFDYVALGHLHSAQSPAPHVWYSGTPLAYSVAEGEKEKGFLSVEVLEGRAPRVEFVPLTPLRRLRRLMGCFAELLANPLPEGERDDYVEIHICDEEPVLNAGERLKALYPRLLGAPQRAFELRYGGTGEGGEESAAPRRLGEGAPDRLETVREDFFAFHKEMTGELPPESLVAVFDSVSREAADASR